MATINGVQITEENLSQNAYITNEALALLHFGIPCEINGVTYTENEYVSAKDEIKAIGY